MAQMVEMVSRQSHRYAGRELSEGETFQCEARHVPALIAMQRAVVSRDMQAGEAPEYRTREIRGGRGGGRGRKA